MPDGNVPYLPFFQPQQQQSPYDAFRGPVAGYMEQEAARQLEGLTEAFGAGGARYSSALAQAQARALAESGERIAGTTWDRTMDYIKDLYTMGATERQMTDADLQTAYQEWLRQQMFPYQVVGGLLGPGWRPEAVAYPGYQEPSAWEKYGPWLQMILDAWE